MSSSPKPPPPAARRKSDHAGLVSHEPKKVADAIPTEAEGDALFDELFGGDAFEDDAASTNQPPASVAAPSAQPMSVEPETQRREEPRPADGTPLGLGPVAPAPASEQDEDIITARPPAPPSGEASEAGSQKPEPTLGELAVQGADIDDHATGEYLGDPHDLSATNELPQARLDGGEAVPYAKPYDMPPVEKSDEIRITDELVVEETPLPTPFGPSVTSDADEDGAEVDFTDAIRPSSRSPLGAVDEVVSTPFDADAAVADDDDDDDDDAATMMMSADSLNLAAALKKADAPPTPTRPQVIPAPAAPPRRPIPPPRPAPPRDRRSSPLR